VQRERIVDRAADPLGLEVRLQLVPSRDPDGVLVKDVLVRRIDRRGTDVGVAGEGRGISPGPLAPRPAPALEVRELGQQHRRLQRVEPAVVADFLVMILPRTAVEAELAQPIGQRVVLGDDHAAVAEAPEILAGKERERAHGTELARYAPLTPDLAPRADGLGRVLDQGEPMALGQGQDRLHGRHLTEQVHHHDPPGPRRDGLLDGLGRDVEGGGIDVHEHRRAARVVDGARGGEEGEGGGDHLVTGLEVEGAKREQEGIGAAGATDGMPAVGKPGHLGLQLSDLGAHDEALALHHGDHRAKDLVLDPAVLRHQVEQRYVHRHPIPRPAFVGPEHHVERARAPAGAGHGTGAWNSGTLGSRVT
jgi:hypothetical protein